MKLTFSTCSGGNEDEARAPRAVLFAVKPSLAVAALPCFPEHFQLHRR
jgi:hypothetical protein